MPIVYASFLINVAIGFWLRDRRTVGRIAAATLFGAIQFFLVTNFAVWSFGLSYPRNTAGLLACYAAGIPFFWNTLAGDAVYAGLLFGGFALAERLFPAFREPAPARRARLTRANHHAYPLWGGACLPSKGPALRLLVPRGGIKPKPNPRRNKSTQLFSLTN